MAEVKEHYNSVADKYDMQYDKNRLYNISESYPANYFRMQLMINSFLQKNIKKIFEVGIGEGTPLLQLHKSGFDVSGCDIAVNMVDKARTNFKNSDKEYDASKIFLGDIRDVNSYVHCLKHGKFDGLVAMGVMPHIENDDLVMKNINSMLNSGGHVFIEFRNKLFSLFTMNRNTVDFIINDLLIGVDKKLIEAVKKDLDGRLRIDQPKPRIVLNNGLPDYDSILSKFHNPMIINDLFVKNGFTNIKLHWYHYHPAMPHLINEDENLFRCESINLEHESSGWRGYFLCSAFIVEATKC